MGRFVILSSVFERSAQVLFSVAAAAAMVAAAAAQAPQKKIKDQAEYDLYTIATKETDATKRLDVFHQMLDLAYQDLPLIPISERAVLIGTRISPQYFQAINNGENFFIPPLSAIK